MTPGRSFEKHADMAGLTTAPREFGKALERTVVADADGEDPVAFVLHYGRAAVAVSRDLNHPDAGPWYSTADVPAAAAVLVAMQGSRGRPPLDHATRIRAAFEALRAHHDEALFIAGAKARARGFKTTARPES